MFRITAKGDLSKTTGFLKRMKNRDYLANLNKFGEMGVRALASQTPTETGKTAGSWSYEVARDSKGASIYWSNSNVNNGVNIAVILQYGHGTGNGGYVVGRDYINPAIRPIFDSIIADMWKEVTR